MKKNEKMLLKSLMKAEEKITNAIKMIEKSNNEPDKENKKESFL